MESNLESKKSCNLVDLSEAIIRLHGYEMDNNKSSSITDDLNVSIDYIQSKKDKQDIIALIRHDSSYDQYLPLLNAFLTLDDKAKNLVSDLINLLASY